MMKRRRNQGLYQPGTRVAGITGEDHDDCLYVLREHRAALSHEDRATLGYVAGQYAIGEEHCTSEMLSRCHAIIRRFIPRG